MKLLLYLRTLLSRRDKIRLLLLICFSVSVSLVEMVGVFLIMPFISVATNFSLIHKNIYLKRLYSFLSFSSAVNFVVFLGLVLIVFYTVRGLLNIIFVYILNRYAQGRFYDVAVRLFHEYIHFNYQHYVSKNSEHVRKLIITDAGYFNQMLVALLMIASEACTIGFLYGMLAWINWKMTGVLTILFTLKILVVVRPFFGLLEEQGKKLGQAHVHIFRMFTEAFGNFKIIKFLNNELFLINRFKAATGLVARGTAFKTMLEVVPRLLIETLGFFMLIGVVVYVIYRYHDATFVIPIVSMYAVAFYRFLPSMNRILANYNQLIFAQSAMDLWEYSPVGKVEHLGTSVVQFNVSVTLRDVTFGYDFFNPVLNGVSLEIMKGQWVAFTGVSGGGKSTLVDVLAGLYKPQNGGVYIDNRLLTGQTMRSWRGMIGYIPQSIYLFDGTVKDNVVFGRSYDENNLILVLKQANIYNFLLEKEGINTLVGEGGIQLSGGQKQRIAIARALYSNPEVLILDEATSALDSETEAKIMDEIYDSSRGRTLLVVAHRLGTIQRCDVIYRVEKYTLSKVVFSSQKDLKIVNV